MNQKKSTSLLFEIGVEEIPSGYFQAAEASIRAKAPNLLTECGWQFDRINVFTTPRRIVIHAENFKPLNIQEEEKLGPQKEQAYENGKPTPALLGFLKSVNRQESDVYYKPTPKGDRICVKFKKERKPLSYFFETLPKQIEFSKLMRWDKTGYLFTRPIRWTFACMGTKFQSYKIADVSSAPFTFGHRFLSPTKLKVTSSDLSAFEKLLLKNHVVLNQNRRLEKIESYLPNEQSKNQELIKTVAHLVEEPFPVKGTFKNDYLKLPVAVLKTCMSKNQKIFACYNSAGKLTNQFLAVINGPRKKIAQIAKNYESVLTSRLEDAQFFFSEDQKTKLETKTTKLKDMIFLGSLGSYLDKTKRMEALVTFLGKESGISPEIVSRAKRAAHLSKADLVTHLVYEFPELQGTAGSEYARLEGESEEVAKAISGHYLPQNLSENYNSLKQNINLEAALVGIVDRIDLLVGAVALSVQLSGSQDPYALRRAAGGIVKIVRAHRLKFSLSNLIDFSCKQYGNLISKSGSEIQKQLISVFKDRLIFELQLKPGTKSYELLEAILATDMDSLIEVYEKFEQLNRKISDDSFIRACKVMERTANILKEIKEKLPTGIDSSIFQDPLEKKLFAIYTKEEDVLHRLLNEKKYLSAILHYGEAFYEPVHDFFDQVLVNAEDSKIRLNRQALVKKINQLCFDVADLSQIKSVEALEKAIKH